MTRTKRQKRVLSGLHKTTYKTLRQRGMTSVSDLVKTLGVSPRECMSIVSDLAILYGVPIGSIRDEHGGVFIATNREEAYIGTAQLYSQYINTKRRIESVRNADFSLLANYDRQCDLL